jgi:hypothetical protein
MVISIDDPALQPPPVNLAPGPEYRSSTRGFQGIPGIERSRNGRLWATWYTGGVEEGPENYVLLVTSADQGGSWSAPKLVIDPPGNVRASDPTLWHDPAGGMWLFWTQSYQLWDGRGGVWAMAAENSSDENPRWGKPRRLADGVVLNKPTVLSSGEWVLPTVIWSWGTPSDKVLPPQYKHVPPERDLMTVLVSSNQGKTWTLRGEAFIPTPNEDIPLIRALEPMILERKDRSLRMLVRTPWGIMESFSQNEGRTWSSGQRSAIPHVNSRFFIRRLKSGRVLLVRHNPPNVEEKDFPKAPRTHLTAFLSDDDGLTWGAGMLLLDERADVSYPDGVEGPDGLVYIIYDYNRFSDKEILMAVFTEEDVACGECISAKSRLRVLVNKA